MRGYVSFLLSFFFDDDFIYSFGFISFWFRFFFVWWCSTIYTLFFCFLSYVSTRRTFYGVLIFQFLLFSLRFCSFRLVCISIFYHFCDESWCQMFLPRMLIALFSPQTSPSSQYQHMPKRTRAGAVEHSTASFRQGRRPR
jgi:hypothetical protein